MNDNRQGRWIISSDGYRPCCSECSYPAKDMTNYCPTCGAKMSDGITEYEYFDFARELKGYCKKTLCQCCIFKSQNGKCRIGSSPDKWDI